MSRTNWRGADYSRLLELYARYSHGLDSQSTRLFRSCFASTVTFGLAGRARPTDADLIVDRMIGRATPGVVHHAFNVVVQDADETGASTRSDFTMTDHLGVKAMGTYEDRVTSLETGDIAFSARIISFSWQRDTYPQ